MFGASGVELSISRGTLHSGWLPIAGRFPVASDQPNERRATAEMGTMGDRLPKLIDNAANLRRLAGQYRKEARMLLHQARLVRGGAAAGDVDDVLARLRQARQKASRCDSFASLCEHRAEAMATLAGFHFANSDTTH